MNQHSWMMIVIPTPELASEKAAKSCTGWGPGMGSGMGGNLSFLCHQARSSGVQRGGVRGLNGLLLKIDSIASRLVR